MSLSRVIDALNSAGLWPTDAELADALWLARYCPPGRTGPTPLPLADARSAPSAGAIPPPAPELASAPPPAHDAPVEELHARDEESVRAVQRPSLPVRIPTVAALPSASRVSHSLRPLKRRVPSKWATELDEEATARRFAETGRWHPVRRPIRTRWLDIALIIDADPSMIIWQRLVEELTTAVARLGAFRDVRRWFLHHHDNGPRLSPTTGTSYGLRDPAELIDPTGQRMILFVSDAIGPAWSTGAVTSMLARYGRCGPTAVLQPLPQRLWDRTAMRARLGRAHATYPGSANNRLRFVPRSDDDVLAGGEVPVPVLEINPTWIHGWTRLVIAAAATDVAISTVAPSPAEDENPAAATSPAARIARFRRHASPEAFHLLRHLAVIPLSIPVIRLVQHATSDDSDPAHLAEVYLSGLLEQIGPVGADRGTVVFDFLAGVRDALLGTLRKAEAAQVLEAVADLLGRQLRSEHEFLAYLSTDPSGDSLRLSVEPFASVARHVLQRMRRIEHSIPDDAEEPAQPEPGRPDLTRQPAIWGAVPLRNPDFTGRGELLDRLRTRLGEPNNHTTVLPVVLHGMAGIGKSQAVNEYLHRYAYEYDLVWWIPADHPSTIRSSFADLARRLGIKASRVDTAIPRVLETLRKGSGTRKWIIVFDNADHSDAIRPFLPTGPGDVIVTSRNPEWGGIARTVEVDLFTRDESRELLRHRSRGTMSDADADRLAEALEDLPLALDQAASWYVLTGMPVAEYVNLLATNSAELLNQGFGEYELPVMAAWNVPFMQLKQYRRDALDLLQLCAFFGPAPISRALLGTVHGASVPSACTDKIKQGLAIREINRYSLAKIDNVHGTIRLHRLVREALRAQLDQQRWPVLRHIVHLMLAGGDPGRPEDHATWPVYAQLLPHVVASRANECSDDRVHNLVTNVVRYLEASGSEPQAWNLTMRTPGNRGEQAICPGEVEL